MSLKVLVQISYIVAVKIKIKIKMKYFSTKEGHAPTNRNKYHPSGGYILRWWWWWQWWPNASKIQKK